MLFRLATRASPKITATALGIALCVMFLSGSFIILDGLRDSTTRVADRFDEGPILAYSTLPFEDGRVSGSIMAGMTENYSAVRVTPVTITFGATTLQQTHAVAASNWTMLRVTRAGVPPGEVWVGKSLIDSASSANITITRGTQLNVTSPFATLELTYIRVHPWTLLPEDWVLVSESTLLQLDATFADEATFLLLNEYSPDIPYLRDAGLTTMPTVAAIDFFRQGVQGIEPTLWGLAVAAGAVIVVLTFTLMALEVRYRARELKTLRKIGASPRFVLSLVLLQALYVSFIGAVLGIALGNIVTNAIVSFAPLVGLSTFVLPSPSLASFAIPFGAAIVAGLLGGILPAVSASRSGLKGVGQRS